MRKQALAEKKQTSPEEVRKAGGALSIYRPVNHRSTGETK
jgi:hypothetical protein